MELTDKQKLRYYADKNLIKERILSDASRDGHIVYGASAVNAQVKSFLNKHTDDVDLYVKNPKKEAVQMERDLDKSFGGDFFVVKKARYPATWKVKSKVTGKTVADYTKNLRRVPTIISGGVKYEKISSIAKSIKNTISGGKADFRVDKDRETLQRIRLSRINGGGF